MQERPWSISSKPESQGHQVITQRVITKGLRPPSLTGHTSTNTNYPRHCTVLQLRRGSADGMFISMYRREAPQWSFWIRRKVEMEHLRRAILEGEGLVGLGLGIVEGEVVEGKSGCWLRRGIIGGRSSWRKVWSLKGLLEDECSWKGGSGRWLTEGVFGRRRSWREGFGRWLRVGSSGGRGSWRGGSGRCL